MKVAAKKVNERKQSTIVDVTAWKGTQKKLKELELVHQAIFENTGTAMAIVEEDTTISLVNAEFERLTGYAKKEIEGKKSWAEFADKNDLERMKQYHRLRRINPALAPRSYEFKFVDKEGNVKDILLTVGMIPGTKKSVCSLMDIIERKKAEEISRKEKEFINTLVQASPAFFMAISADGKTMMMNQAMLQALGYTENEVVGRDYLTTFVPEQNHEMLSKVFEKMVKSHEPSLNENRVLTKDGRELVIEWHGRPVFKEDGELDFFFGVGTDITERKRVEEALKESERKYRLLAENITDVVFIQDMNLNLTYVSPSATQLFGYNVEEGLKLKMKDLMTPDSFKKAMDSFQEKAVLAQAKEDVDIPLMEYEYVRKDGSTFWGELKVTFLRDSKGRPVGVQGVLRDITKRKKTEQLMQALNKAAMAMEQAMTQEEVFTAVAEELIALGFSCAALSTDKSQKILYPQYLCYDANAMKAAEELVKIKVKDFSIPVEVADVFKEVVWQKKTVFVENAEEVLRQSLPGPVRKFSEQIAKMLKVQKSIAAPLVVEDEVIALFSVQSDDLTRDDIPTIIAFATQMSAALRKAKLLQELQKSLAEQKRVKEDLQESLQKLRKTLEQTVHALASAIEMRDPYTAGHQRRVTKLACAIAKERGLTKEQIEGLRVSASIHDIGKINIALEILSKPDRLTELEFEMIKTHPQTGYEILKEIEFPWPVAEIVLQHHERMDGSGYPQGLSGKSILMEARILGVADVVEAMASHRPYRPAFGIDKALEEISKNKGVLYDPEFADACLKLFTEKGFKLE